MKTIPVLLAGACALAMSGCTQQGFEAGLSKFSAGLITFNASVARYAPIIGRDLLLVGQDLVVAECSPLTPVVGQAANNLLKITAPSSRVAARISDALATNTAVAQQLCPLVTLIQAQVGAVPRGTPSQAVALPPG